MSNVASPIRAVRALVEICHGIELEGFQLPDGSYRIGQSSAAQAIGKPSSTFRQVLTAKHPQPLALSEIYLPIKVRYEDKARPKMAVTLQAAALYWTYWASKENEIAIALAKASTSDVLIRRFDFAFSVPRYEWEHRERFKAAFTFIQDRETKRLAYQQLQEGLHPEQVYCTVRGIQFAVGCYMDGTLTHKEFLDWIDMYRSTPEYCHPLVVERFRKIEALLVESI